MKLKKSMSVMLAIVLMSSSLIGCSNTTSDGEQSSVKENTRKANNELIAAVTYEPEAGFDATESSHGDMTRVFFSTLFQRNKELGMLRSKQSKCVKGSKQYNKYSKAMYSLKYKTDNRILDTVHKITKLYLEFCLENKISLIYYGDCDSATRNTKGKVGNSGQKLSQWNYGLIMKQIINKLSRYEIQTIKVPEYYTSQACPNCGLLNKPVNRNYICECGYTQHRDILGAINILNMNHGTDLTHYIKKKYLRIE
jgi:putative transposase